MGKSLLLFFLFALIHPLSVRAEGTAELLGKAYELSSKISALGNLGDKKIETPKVAEFNTQMKENNSLTQTALSQLAGQMNVSLPNKGDNSEMSALESLKGKAFEKMFLNKSTGLQSQLLDLVKSKLMPGLSSPLAAGLLKSFTPGLGSLVEKGQALQKMMGK